MDSQVRDALKALTEYSNETADVAKLKQLQKRLEQLASYVEDRVIDLAPAE